MMAKSSMAGLRIMHEDTMKSSVGTMQATIVVLLLRGEC
jgi:hypothetical protein